MTTMVLLHFLVLVHLCSVTVTEKLQFNVAVLLPWGGHWPVAEKIAGAMPVAIRDVSQRGLLKSLNMTYAWRDTQCHAGVGLAELFDLHQAGKIQAIIGGGCDEVCNPVAQLAAQWNMPMVSWG
jgi:hypothetical protein